MTPQIISVTEFVAILNETMQFAFPSVLIEGEVSGWKVWQNRYVYFDIKDNKTTLSCFMPLYLVKTPVEDGMDVRVEGSPKLTDKGRFSLTVKSLELTGEGAIRRAYELLKTKLEHEGLFGFERKRLLPEYPSRIGLVTAPASAAYADFMKIVNARWGGLTIEVAPVQVQGKVAPDQIVAAISYFNQQAGPVDVIVLIRGGGSLEDLQAFNAEAVARALVASRIPTLVGVGHEVDISLADLVADVRAATPTDAAQRLVPDRREIAQQLDVAKRNLGRALDAVLKAKVDQVEVTLRQLTQFTERPRRLLDVQTTWLEAYPRRFEQQIRLSVSQVDQHSKLLHAMNPRGVLSRGYSITRLEGRAIRDLTGIKPGCELVIELQQGIIDSKVTGTRDGNR